MISAKDEFFLEREMINELKQMVYSACLPYEEQEAFFERINGEMTAEEFRLLSLYLIQRNLHALTRIRNGETLMQGEINKAVKKAADDETK